MDRDLKIKIVIILVVFIVSITTFLAMPKIKLNGDKEIKLEYGHKYKEEGAYVSSFFKKRKAKIKIDNKIDYDKIGSYEVKYSTDYLKRKLSVTRKVNIVDTEKPKLELKGEKTAIVCPNQKYKEEGYNAYDNYDKDLTDKVKTTNEEDKIIYEVSDSSKNITKLERNIKYEDKTVPVLTLNGNQDKTLYLNQTYNEEGATAIDNCEGDISKSIKIEGNVNTSVLGTYKVTYSVKDSHNNEVKIERNIRVVPRPNNRDKTIYLTFDDGPSASITPGILKILKEENVKATFFVVGASSNLDYLIRQAYNDGHTIGLHSYTHNYKTVYSSVNGYFDDLTKIQNRVYNITGNKSKIIRFPGGSSNTVSRNYYRGIMGILTRDVQNRGYQYFDWNVDSNDAGSARTSNDVYNNVTRNLNSKSNIVLMHDFEGNTKTLNALRDIIRYGKENGYNFDSIKLDTFPAHHGVNN